MDLVLTGEQKQVRDGAHQLFKERGGPARLRALRHVPRAIGDWKGLAGLGWVGMSIPERVGGNGLAEIFGNDEWHGFSVGSGSISAQLPKWCLTH